MTEEREYEVWVQAWEREGIEERESSHNEFVCRQLYDLAVETGKLVVAANGEPLGVQDESRLDVIIAFTKRLRESLEQR